uniref:Putative secreted protein n=1 Tax=Psorophora albipes TaxID=869069 RepID=T1E3G5_9DIPT
MTSTQRQHQMQHGTTLHLVVLRRFVIVHLLAGENQTLLLRGNAFLLLHPLLDPIHFVRGFNVNLDFLSGEGLHFDQHFD